MDEPRWLTDEQQQMWRRFVEVLIRVPAALETQLQRDAGLTHMGYVVLLTLSERHDRRMPMSRLARASARRSPGSRTWWPGSRGRAGCGGSAIRRTAGCRSRC